SVLTAWQSVVGFGLFLLLMFHVLPFRRAVVAGLRIGWTVVRYVFWDLPVAASRSPVVRAIRYSAPVRFVRRHLGAAIVVTAVAVLVLAFLGAPADRLLLWGGLVFAVSVLAFNTPWGGVLQERLAEQVADWWRVVRVNL